MRNELLLELYSEEIPALMQKKAEEDFKKLFSESLTKQQISFSNVQTFIGPCRIAILVQDIAMTTPEQKIERKGPRIDAPLAAIEGFCKSVQKTQDELNVQDIGGHKFYFYQESIAAQPVAKLLPELICSVLAGYVWPKSMYWGDNNITWVRPLKNILCLLNGKVLELSYGHLVSNDYTFGHKFMAPHKIQVRNFEDYHQKLHDNFVILDRSERHRLIVESLKKYAQENNLIVSEDDKLLDEVTGLVEYPNILMGSIAKKFMHVPSEILISAMRNHQKYFTLEEQDGSFAAKFLFAANITSEDCRNIIQGNENVLSARLSDAKFFYEEDLNHDLEHFYNKLSAVTFHNNIVHMRQKADRLVKIVAHLSPNNQEAELAAKYAKSDLTSNVVGEFPELQGIIGKYYATNMKLSHNIAQAISDHYKPLGPKDLVPKGLGATIALADKLDSLVGLYIAGERATGSKDPYALRRYALGIIRIILENGLTMALSDLISFIMALYNKQDDKLFAEILLFLEERAKYYFRDLYDYKLVSATLNLKENSNLLEVSQKLSILHDFIQSEDGGSLVAAYKRAYNIISQASKQGMQLDGDIDQQLMQDTNEINLYNSIEHSKEHITYLLKKIQYREALDNFAELATPVNKFFDNVLVLDEDKAIAKNRLKILQQLVSLFQHFANFSEL